MMLQVKTYKTILLALLLCAAAQQVPAQENGFSKGVFSIGPTTTVRIALTNYEKGGVERFQWKDGGKYAGGEDRVLSSAEWTYLLVTRDAGKEQKEALGEVAGINGLIILPDDWVQPNGVPAFKPTTQGMGYDQNIYTAEQWGKMEAAGAVFLPCRGYGHDQDGQIVIEDEEDHGSYWASNSFSQENGYCMRFDNLEIHDVNNADKTLYYSVRLVRKVTVLDENDEQDVFADKFEEIKQQPNQPVFVRRPLLHNGYFNTLCLPFEVDVENSPLAGADVFTVQSGTVVDGNLQVNIAPIGDSHMEAGVPYLIRWQEAETIPLLIFNNVSETSWVANAADAGTSGDAALTYQGFFGMTHIADETNGANEHYNFFLYNENELCWPEDGSDPNAKMKGFRAYFSLTPSASAVAPRYRGMPAKLQEVNINDHQDVITELDQQIVAPHQLKVFDADKVVIILDGKKYSIGGQEL